MLTPDYDSYAFTAEGGSTDALLDIRFTRDSLTQSALERAPNTRLRLPVDLDSCLVAASAAARRTFSLAVRVDFLG